ncbi:MAG: hypothetical protein LQ345_000189 [Seirophora villosa]|nr:MAG: hypothetical protein LQ345_000189 [Seirophora villosa]
MMRNKPSSSMQKTYDECYLICSTAVYFEGQNNEAEALRSWRSALDQIYYHNAYRVPPNYRPKSETEKALQDSLRDMEMQCKERVDILEALRRSRAEANDGPEQATNNVLSRGRSPLPPKKSDISAPLETVPGFIGQAASKAAGLAWDSTSRLPSHQLGQTLASQNGSTTTLDSPKRDSLSGDSAGRKDSAVGLNGMGASRGVRPRTPEPNQLKDSSTPNGYSTSYDSPGHRLSNNESNRSDLSALEPPLPAAQRNSFHDSTAIPTKSRSPSRQKNPVEPLTYRTEYPPTTPSSRMVAEYSARVTNSANSPLQPMRRRSPQGRARPPAPRQVSRRPVANISSPRAQRQDSDGSEKSFSLESTDDSSSRNSKAKEGPGKTAHKERTSPILDGAPSKKPSKREQSPEKAPATQGEARIQRIKKHLPKGVDENAAKQIFNEIVVSGDEVHWDDVAGLDIAKKALKEAVVYPFLRPDLFMGLREPARGMLLFGPPGTGKTMLARAVATESRSTFFAISASSLTSKWLGESEKLVRALFSLAKALAPSIIFVDEIDSLLSSRGGSSEHESTRRIKTEFLIQWSDLQKAAAGKQQSEKEKQEGDASRVLVLAATNMPWAIDEAARRRFVRRQYIPLPERHVRESQLRTLLSHQKHNLKGDDIQVLVGLTDAKDAAMGPLRSLGEALLYMSMDEIRPIQFEDFEASLVNIRPSVSKEGLQEFDDWAKEYGERGG